MTEEHENCIICTGYLYFGPPVVTQPFPDNDLSSSPEVEAAGQMPASDPSVCQLMADLGDFLQQLP